MSLTNFPIWVELSHVPTAVLGQTFTGLNDLLGNLTRYDTVALRSDF